MMKTYVKLKEERGVAMITVIVVSAVIMVLGGGMYMLASRENSITRADYVGGQAFYYAEGGLENAIDILNYAATETQLTRPRADQSSDGYGYLMDPSPGNRPVPTDPIQMNIGGESFTVWVDEVDQNGNHCVENCGLNLRTTNPAYLMITAEGRSSEGYRRVRQQVKLEASGFPVSLFIDGNVHANGNVALTNQSMYVRGDLFGREKFVASGSDLVSGGSAAIWATGTIYENSNGNSSQIYTSLGAPNIQTGNCCWDDNYINDRDKRGPTGNTFSLAELQGMMETGGLTTSQLQILKGMAQANGYYASFSNGENIVLNQADIPNHDGNIVVYIEYTEGVPEDNEVSIKFEWPHEPYTDGQAWVIVRNGSAKLTGNLMGSFVGVVYCPDGPVRVDGSGSGDFTGTVWGKGLTDIGNFNFVMTEDFLNDPPFFGWTVVRMTEWTEVDR